LGEDPVSQSKLMELVGSVGPKLKKPQLQSLASDLTTLLERYPSAFSYGLLDQIHQKVSAGDVAGATKQLGELLQAEGAKALAATKQGTFKLDEYHGGSGPQGRHDFPQTDLETILKTPDAVHFDGEVYTFRKGDNVAIVWGPGRNEGQVITAYGPAGKLGKSG